VGADGQGRGAPRGRRRARGGGEGPRRRERLAPEPAATPAPELIVEAAPLAEGESRGLRVSTPEGPRWVLVARLGGRLVAIDDVCNHAGRLLSEGRRDGTAVTCAGHGITFDLRDGRCLTPGVDCGDQPAFDVEEPAPGRLVLRPRG
jgi:nitrite reductase/ring-hydroxylating ferredoxin subunit